MNLHHPPVLLTNKFNYVNSQKNAALHIVALLTTQWNKKKLLNFKLWLQFYHSL